jgi:hypothetical protein
MHGKITLHRRNNTLWRAISIHRWKTVWLLQQCIHGFYIHEIGLTGTYTLSILLMTVGRSGREYLGLCNVMHDLADTGGDNTPGLTKVWHGNRNEFCRGANSAHPVLTVNFEEWTMPCTFSHTNLKGQSSMIFIPFLINTDSPRPEYEPLHV